jgi:MoxR-like ATPase
VTQPPAAQPVTPGSQVHTPAADATALERVMFEIKRVIVGQDRLVERMLVGLLARGHCLLEGVPGVAKTLAVETLARTVNGSFARLQFTPDLVPSDIIGTRIYRPSSERFDTELGPIFANFILADEINRAPAKVQSALLEVMAERQVSIGGTRYPVPSPFLVLATQNPIEHEGTYPLPEAQLDRFLLKVLVPYPDAADLAKVVDRTTGRDHPTAPRVMSASEITKMRALAREVVVAPVVRDLAVHIVLATHPTNPKAPDEVRRFVRYGASPRGAQSLIACAKVQALRKGRAHADVSDVRALIPASLRHRLILNFEGEAEGLTTDRILEAVSASVK